MNDILARRARRATAGIALSAALVAGIAPVTAIAAETSAPTGAAVSQTSAANGNSGAPQTEDAAAAKEKAYAAMQEALKNLEAAKNAASPEKIAEIDTKMPFFKRTTTLIWRKLPYIRNPFLPCKRTSMQPNPNAIRPTTEQETLRQN